MTDEQKLLANKQMDCSRAGLALSSPLVPMAVVASMASVVPEAVTALLAPVLTIGIMQPRLPYQEKLMDSKSQTGGQNWWNAS